MAAEKAEILLIGAAKPAIVGGLEPSFVVHKLIEAKDPEAFLKDVAPRIRGIAIAYTSNKIDGAFMSRFPKLEIVSSFGVGYDHVDAKWAGEHGIVVTNTPEVLNEEVADTALGLLLCTLREFPQAERYLRAGKWVEKGYPLTQATLRDRTVGIVGMGRIGKAIARRLDAFGVTVVYHSRNPQAGVAYKYYPKLIDMARDVDTLMVIVPGGAGTKNLIDARGAEGARSERRADQHGARLGGGRTGFDPGAEGPHHSHGRARCVRQRAACTAGTDRDGSHRAVPASGLGVGCDPQGDGSAGGGQSESLVFRQASANPGSGNAGGRQEIGVMS